MAAVQRHNGLLKASIASATNEHRLGANEAPPAIISMFLGAQITDVIDRLLDTDVDDDIAFSAKEGMKLKTCRRFRNCLSTIPTATVRRHSHLQATVLNSAHWALLPTALRR